MRSMERLAIALAIGGATMIPAGAAAQKSADIFFIEYREAGSFLNKTTKELGTPQAAGIITAACAVFYYDCSREAAALTGLVKQASARMTEPGGEAHGYHVFAPPGYDVCRASVNGKNWGVSGQSSLQATILNADDRGNPNGPYYLTMLINVPKNRPEGHWAFAEFAVEYVPIGTRAQNGCWPVGSHPFWCRVGRRGAGSPDCDYYEPGGYAEWAPKYPRP